MENCEIKNIESEEFIHNIDFEYIETYSLLRGEKYENEYKSLKKEFNTLSAKNKRQRTEPNEITRLKEIEQLVGFTQYLTNSEGKFHFSAEKIILIDKREVRINELKKILSKKVVNKIDWMCAPIYRDAIVFYNLKNEIVKILNICFSCEHMETENKMYVDADTKTYEELKIFLLKIGHKIEKQ